MSDEIVNFRKEKRKIQRAKRLIEKAKANESNLTRIAYDLSYDLTNIVRKWAAEQAMDELQCNIVVQKALHDLEAYTIDESWTQEAKDECNDIGLDLHEIRQEWFNWMPLDHEGREI